MTRRDVTLTALTLIIAAAAGIALGFWLGIDAGTDTPTAPAMWLTNLIASLPQEKS